MQRFRQYFLFFVLLNSFFIKSERNILIDAGKIACLGVVVACSQIYSYDLLFQLKFIDKYNPERLFKVKDNVLPVTLGVLSIIIAGTFGPWPKSEIKNLVIPTAVGVITNLTVFWLKLEKLKKDTKEKRYKEALDFVIKTNVLFVTSLCLYSLYNRYVKAVS